MKDLSDEILDSAPKLSLNEFLARENLQKINGKYQPDNKQLKMLVRYDEVNLGEIDTSKITNMKDLFAKSKRRDFSGIESWDTSKVTTFMSCFENAVYFNENINAWNVSNATNFMQMFYGAKAFNQPLDSWNVGNVVDMQGVFSEAESFNQDLSGWGTKLGKVRNAKRAFADTKSLTIDFLKSWEATLSDSCDTENIIKGSALESKAQSTQIKDKFYNLFIFECDSNLQKRFAESMQNRDFYNDSFYNEWLPQNIKETCKIYLAKENDESFIKGGLQDWDFALCEVIESIFLICKNDKRLDEISGEMPLCAIIQGRKESDFKYGDEIVFDKNAIKGSFATENQSIAFDSKNVWIVNNAQFNANATALKIANAFMVAQSYKAKMQDLENMAKSRQDSNTLRKCYKKICEFDLYHYRSIPVAQDKSTPLLLNIWQKISAVYMVAQTHDELKEVIAQMAQILGDDMKEKESRRFNIAMGVIGVLSALGAILAAIPVVEKWVN